MTEQMKGKLSELTKAQLVYIVLAAIMLVLLMAVCGCASISSAETPDTEFTDIDFPDIEADIENENLLSTEQAVFVAGTNNIIINAGSEWELEGVLTLPEGIGPFPLVVIVHGSGRADKYRYRDLTNFLAEQGIASIRHEKRPTAYPKINQDVNFTLKEESVDDALSAVALAKTIEKINQDMIFVLGHSQGGFLIPKVHEGDKDDMIAGFISLAGKPRSIREELKEYIEMESLIISEMSEERLKEYNGTLKLYDAIKSLTEEEIKSLTEEDINNLTDEDIKSLTGADTAYWLYIIKYDALESAKNICKPVLFLQGDNDTIVMPDDLYLWQSAAQNNPQAVYKLYPDLDHHFRKPNSAVIEKEVVIDIAEFIKSQYN